MSWIMSESIVNVSHFRRVMGVRTCESRCLFSGSKGEVCCIEPLHSKPELKDHPITQFSLLAMASLTKVGMLRRQSPSSRDFEHRVRIAR